MGEDLPDDLAETLRKLANVLHQYGVSDFAITGSVALGIWAAPRHTRDIDLCGTLPLQSVNALLAFHDGIRSGPGELPDLVRFRVADWDVDLFVSKSNYDRTCLQRSTVVTVAGVTLRVVTCEDLLIHKLIKLRHDRRRLLQDLADVRTLLEVRAADLDWTYLREWLPHDELALLENVRDLDDETLIERLLNRAN